MNICSIPLPLPGSNKRQTMIIYSHQLPHDINQWHQRELPIRIVQITLSAFHQQQKAGNCTTASQELLQNGRWIWCALLIARIGQLQPAQPLNAGISATKESECCEIQQLDEFN